ncbi:MAG TPA: hypothetical protein VG452_08565 [Egibacteraceae bacterium]|nr:hypothetical protein [Egibacteraceae bacterium]
MLAGVVDLLLPPRCPACGQPATAALCVACLAAAGTLALGDHGRAVLAEGVAAVGAFAYAGVIAAAVRSVKAGGRHAAMRGLGALMWDHLGLPAPARAPWAVTWVPSSRRRLRQRGVELTRLLAGPGAVALLRRPLERPDQTTLEVAARRASPVGAFAPTGPTPAAVVLVDDVRTTGATATAAGLALRSGGARRVLVATLAVAGADAGAQARTPGARGPTSEGRPAPA